MLTSVDAFWKLFECTGSVAAYMMYKQIALQ